MLEMGMQAALFSLGYLWALRIFKPGFSMMTVVPAGTEEVSQTLEPMMESLPMTVLPPNIVALA